jgi:hypothetical protein
VAIGAFRLDENAGAWKRASGTGGFALLGETALPVVQDLNTREGREAWGLDDAVMTGVTVVPLRVREGDDASCLNLNRAQTPRLLGVKPELLAARGAFTFAKVLPELRTTNGWMALQIAERSASDDTAVPAIGDAASIQWALGKKLGETLDYTDERGRKFKVRLVGAVANSILQGSLLIDEAEFVRRFPGESGYRMFLLDAPSNAVSQVSAKLSRALQDVGPRVDAGVAAVGAVQRGAEHLPGHLPSPGRPGAADRERGPGRGGVAQRARATQRVRPPAGGRISPRRVATPRLERARRAFRPGSALPGWLPP